MGRRGRENQASALRPGYLKKYRNLEGNMESLNANILKYF
jgi:hypothetical protein